MDKHGGQMSRIALWDHLLKQGGDVFAETYISFNVAGRTPAMQSIPVVIEFIDGRILRATLAEAKFFEMSESFEPTKIKRVSFPT
jgi:hypothetical protein